MQSPLLLAAILAIEAQSKLFLAGNACRRHARHAAANLRLTDSLPEAGGSIVSVLRFFFVRYLPKGQKVASRRASHFACKDAEENHACWNINTMSVH
jgi:hypothetical protein